MVGPYNTSLKKSSDVQTFKHYVNLYGYTLQEYYSYYNFRITIHMIFIGKYIFKMMVGAETLLNES